uniref:DUF4219 domain-containing protein n=1 Tax=Peronospora matthiolae TaxID=2874970 RepID=A0AAV1U672_9STRA
MDASSLRISKFDGTNFHAWKFKMQMVLEERDLWEVVSVEKTAAVKKTPRQAASSVEASGRPSFAIPVGTGMYQ